MATVDRAVQIAAKAHEGQKDNRNLPYILHPMRLMAKMSTETEMMAAALHDVVEDTPLRLDDLRAEGFPEDILAAVDCLTHRYGESYEEYIVRLRPNAIARKVKLADLEDNMDMKGYVQLKEEDVVRWRRYIAAWKELTKG